VIDFGGAAKVRQQAVLKYLTENHPSILYFCFETLGEYAQEKNESELDIMRNARKALRKKDYESLE
jgi:hypothetical protein